MLLQHKQYFTFDTDIIWRCHLCSPSLFALCLLSFCGQLTIVWSYFDNGRSMVNWQYFDNIWTQLYQYFGMVLTQFCHWYLCFLSSFAQIAFNCYRQLQISYLNFLFYIYIYLSEHLCHCRRCLPKGSCTCYYMNSVSPNINNTNSYLFHCSWWKNLSTSNENTRKR